MLQLESNEWRHQAHVVHDDARVGAAIGVREYVRSELQRRLSPRELDRLLLAMAASRKRAMVDVNYFGRPI